MTGADVKPRGVRYFMRVLADWLRPWPVEVPPDPWSLDVRIFELEQISRRVRVTIDPHFIPEDCRWCMRPRPEITAVRVYGNPDCESCLDDGMRRLVMVETCQRCATAERGGPVRQALVEAGQFQVIQVEVCP